ncbi:MAG: hypothetical protein K9L64_07150 [Candidatus Izimaplasma sp.]|nr:hypothetical protein [Candidatus Izimaplasma bacterium]
MLERIFKKFFVITCFILLLFASFATTRLIALSSESNTSTSENAHQIKKISYKNDGIVLYPDENSNKTRKIELTYEFFEFESFYGNYYIADVIGNADNLINLSLEENLNGYIINIAFYDQENDQYTYYFDKVDDKTLNQVKEISKPSAFLEIEYAKKLYSSTKWYINTFDTNLVSNSDIKISEKENEKLLKKYSKKDSQKNSALEYYEKSSYDISSLEYMITTTSASNDDSVTMIIPRSYFTYPGKKTGSVGSFEYYVETSEYPEDSDRYISDVLVWTNTIYAPSYSSDTAKIVTKPEFSGLFDYAENGYYSLGTPVDEVQQIDDYSTLALRSLYSKITLELTSSYGNDNVQYDYDEFIYHMDASHNGYRYEDNGISLSGVSSAIAAIAGLAVTATPWPDDPLFWSLGLGSTSLGLFVVDGQTQTDNGIASSIQNGSDFFSANFVADRSAHYSTNGGKYVRQVKAQLDRDVFFGPNNHSNFSNMDSKFTFSAYLEREGTDIYDQKKLEYYNSVKIVTVQFYWWFGTQKTETYKAYKSMTQEKTYYRYYIPYYY